MQKSNKSNINMFSVAKAERDCCCYFHNLCPFFDLSLAVHNLAISFTSYWPRKVFGFHWYFELVVYLMRTLFVFALISLHL